MADERKKALRRRWLCEAKGGQCQRCGYKRCRSALEFHHLKPKDKCFEIGQHLDCNWEGLVEEVKKCVLLCSNCHKEIHADMFTMTKSDLFFDIGLISDPIFFQKMLSGRKL